MNLKYFFLLETLVSFYTSVALLLDKRTDRLVLEEALFVVDEDDIEEKLEELEEGIEFELECATWVCSVGGERPSLRRISSDFSGFCIIGGGFFFKGVTLESFNCLFSVFDFETSSAITDTVELLVWLSLGSSSSLSIAIFSLARISFELTFCSLVSLLLWVAL